MYLYITLLVLNFPDLWFLMQAVSLCRIDLRKGRTHCFVCGGERPSTIFQDRWSFQCVYKYATFQDFRWPDDESLESIHVAVSIILCNKLLCLTEIYILYEINGPGLGFSPRNSVFPWQSSFHQWSTFVRLSFRDDDRAKCQHLIPLTHIAPCSLYLR